MIDFSLTEEQRACRKLVRDFAQKEIVPLIVTENGIGAAGDTHRLEYYRRALQGVANCLNDGLDMRGYYAWSALDNFEWLEGYRPKFGIIAVDRETQERTVNSSGRWLSQVARANES